MRGWRSTENGPTFQEFNKQYEDDRMAKREAAREGNGCAGTMNWFGDNYYGVDYLQLYVL